MAIAPFSAMSGPEMGDLLPPSLQEKSKNVRLTVLMLWWSLRERSYDAWSDPKAFKVRLVAKLRKTISIILLSLRERSHEAWLSLRERNYDAWSDPKAFKVRLVVLLKESSREAWSDLKAFKWGRAGKWFLFVNWLSTLLAFIIIFFLGMLWDPLILSILSITYIDGPYGIDGTFSLSSSPIAYDWWVEGFFPSYYPVWRPYLYAGKDYRRHLGHYAYRYKGGYEESRCYLQYRISTYAKTYGFFNVENITTYWNGTELDAPALNIEAFYYVGKGNSATCNGGDYLWGYNWTDPRTGTFPLRDKNNRRFVLRNESYPASYVIDNGACQPVQQSCENGNGSDFSGCSAKTQLYSWGFSLAQLCINVIFILIWSVGIFIMWLKSHLQLPLKGTPEVPRGWRALMELAESISRELRMNGIEPRSLTDRQLKRQIYKQLKGGSVSFDQEVLERPGFGFRHGLRLWLKEKRWWLIFATPNYEVIM
ncbi:hypothetical protein B0T17DRAFT_646969 [Bombardia bombarda]|uniref:Uncharacterized protein n=1 Tax=Bombardia bombarda TaxID=252184 RepID=A0AA40BVJ0_9PEZI|nr:hypothetical protein B0T17DRAFT_646969 [Bombardia bombarda]